MRDRSSASHTAENVPWPRGRIRRSEGDVNDPPVSAMTSPSRSSGSGGTGSLERVGIDCWSADKDGSKLDCRGVKSLSEEAVELAVRRGGAGGGVGRRISIREEEDEIEEGGDVEMSELPWSWNGAGVGRGRNISLKVCSLGWSMCSTSPESACTSMNINSGFRRSAFEENASCTTSRWSVESRRALAYLEGKIRETLKRELLDGIRLGVDAAAVWSTSLSALLLLLAFLSDDGRGGGGEAAKEDAKKAWVLEDAGGDEAALSTE